MAATPLTLALYQPDIPQNAGSMLRSCACFGFEAAIIGPAGFPVTDRNFRRAGMDYLDLVTIRRHVSFETFQAWRAEEAIIGAPRRLILLTTKATASYASCDYGPGDVLLVGRETSGVPEEVADAADLAVTIPMRSGARSLNVGVAAAIVMSEARRQFPDLSPLTRRIDASYEP